MSTIPSPGQGVTEEELKVLEAMDPTGTSWSAAPSQPTLIKMVGKFDRIVDCAIAYSESDPNFGEKIAAHVITTHNALPRLIAAARCGLWANIFEHRLKEVSAGNDILHDLLKESRETSTRLNRRCQEAEAGLREKLTAGDSMGRRLANAAASMFRRERDTAVAALAVATEQLRWRYQVEPWLKEGEERELPALRLVENAHVEDEEELPHTSDWVDVISRINGIYDIELGSYCTDGRGGYAWVDCYGAEMEAIAWRPRPSVPSDVGGREVVK